jgi:hypothetical protein
MRMGLEREYGRECRGSSKEVSVGWVLNQEGELGFSNGAPKVGAFTADDVELVGVEQLVVLRARRRSIMVKRERGERDGRTIFLVIKTCLFLCRQRR